MIKLTCGNCGSHIFMTETEAAFYDFFDNGNETSDEEDIINHPKHYKTDTGLEAIDVIEAFTENLQGIDAVCTANVLKYICRWHKKNGLDDLKKAQWYLDKLIRKKELETLVKEESKLEILGKSFNCADYKDKASITPALRRLLFFRR